MENLELRIGNSLNLNYNECYNEPVDLSKPNDSPDFPTFKTDSQYHATKVWNGIVNHLKKSVEVKKRRVLLRSYDRCFTGSDAVHAIFHYNNAENAKLGTKPISRLQAAMVCQVMMKLKVIESVHDGEKVFEDSATKLYRFVNPTNGELNLFSGALNEPSDNSNDKVVSPDRNQRKMSENSLDVNIIGNHGVVFRSPEKVTTEQCKIDSCPVDVHYIKIQPHDVRPRGVGRSQTGNRLAKWCSFSSINQLEDNQTLSPCYNWRRPLWQSSRLRFHCKSQSSLMTLSLSSTNLMVDEEDFLREVALSSLLMLVDVPLLDGIVYAEPQPLTIQGSSFSHLGLAFANFNFKRFDSTVAAEHYFNRSADKWWKYALDCLELIPGGLDIYSEVFGATCSMKPQNHQKIDLFNQMTNCYGQLSRAIWPENYSDIQIELYRLLMQNQLDQGLKAIQLSLFILHKESKEHIRRLLAFMKCAASENEVKLSYEATNRSVIEKTLSCAIIKNRNLTHHQTGQLIMFMVDNMIDIWKLPREVIETFKARLDSGEQFFEKTFCCRISEDEFCRQQVELTEKSLVDLMNHILDNTSITLKEKKQRLKQFAKHHPTIYLKHFSNCV